MAHWGGSDSARKPADMHYDACLSSYFDRADNPCARAIGQNPGARGSRCGTCCNCSCTGWLCETVIQQRAHLLIDLRLISRKMLGSHGRRLHVYCSQKGEPSVKRVRLRPLDSLGFATHTTKAMQLDAECIDTRSGGVANGLYRQRTESQPNHTLFRCNGPQLSAPVLHGRCILSVEVFYADVKPPHLRQFGWAPAV